MPTPAEPMLVDGCGLAFGCGGLGGSTGFARAERLLDAAWDAGIRHFDVAPAYGFGEAEVQLGRMLARFGAEARVTTKVGIGRGLRPSPLVAGLRRAARVVLGATPGLRRRLGNRLRASQPRGQFDLPGLRASVEQSLRALRREQIDLLLLHEATAADLTDELMDELARLIAAGKIGAAGIGSAAASLAAIPALPPLLTCRQYEWRLDGLQLPPAPGVRANRHGVMHALPDLARRLAAVPGLAGRLAELTGLPCDHAGDHARLLLALARHEAPGGQIIVRSDRPERIAALAGLPPAARPAEALALLRATGA